MKEEVGSYLSSCISSDTVSEEAGAVKKSKVLED